VLRSEFGGSGGGFSTRTFDDENYKFGWLQGSRKLLKEKTLLVAAGGFEPPTFGL
jgi:hypothetical protein